MLLLSLTIGIMDVVTCWSAALETADIRTTMILVTAAFFVSWAIVQAVGYVSAGGGDYGFCRASR
jgi:hypothetical protein